MSNAPTELFVSEPRIPAPAVSVLVPICNVERYLVECLDSLLSQTFSDFEAICINDGSTDGSRAIIQRYLDADPRFRIVDKPNSGYGASMNIGLDHAVGTYIAILESDDFYEPNALELLVKAARDRASDVVKADFYLHWSQPEPHDELFGILDERQIGRTMRPLDDVAIFFRKPSIWSALYNASFLKANGIRFLETPGASYQDAGFNFKVWASAERATFISQAILHYRQDNEKSSVNSAAKVFCVCDEYASMRDFVEGLSSDRALLFGILERMKFDSYMWNYDRLAPELCEGFAVRIAGEFSEDLIAGRLDFGLFEPWAASDLKALMRDPVEFNEKRATFIAPGKLNTFKHYYRIGGLGLVAQVVACKLSKSSVRRTNERGGAL